ncbi:hypothetical protein K402DRAFT_118351 [Aulographum hederae CBS 113979]|uniref:Uncharacterized protein n=1 Tax=Aulographum hederae CBS 113979 TaxID=1176131 RepID=A0A6G1GWD6_9PEZI|nr:hypothetical protein K402DRAFT_118351 [Aulographum hederae CBS 113979]
MAIMCRKTMRHNLDTRIRRRRRSRARRLNTDELGLRVVEDGKKYSRTNHSACGTYGVGGCLCTLYYLNRLEAQSGFRWISARCPEGICPANPSQRSVPCRSWPANLDNDLPLMCVASAHGVYWCGIK